MFKLISISTTICGEWHGVNKFGRALGQIDAFQKENGLRGRNTLLFLSKQTLLFILVIRGEGGMEQENGTYPSRNMRQRRAGRVQKGFN